VIWYILKNGIKEGPYSDEQLGELIANDYIQPDDLVWKPGFGQWMLATDVPGLLAPPSTTPKSRHELPPKTASPESEVSYTQISEPLKPSLTRAEPSLQSDRPLRKARRGTYLFRHWRGELSLPVSYWVNGILLAASFAIVLAIVPWTDFINEAPKLYSASMVALLLLLEIATVWQFVGIWRSAGNYIRQGKPRVWGNLARVAVALGLIQAAYYCASGAIPQITEFAQIAAGKDPLGTYQLRVLRDATEVEIAGPMAFGITDEVRRILDAHPTVRIIHLNSEGGRVYEARKLRDLFSSRGLTTYTSSGCLSACTLAYAGGRERLIAKDGALGFHQYSFPGLKDRDFHSEYEKDEQDWLARGFSRAFVEKAFATPNNDMWRPSQKELIEAGVVTGYPENNDVAVTGFKLSDLASVEAEFAKIPLFSTLKRYEPTTYDRLITEIRSGLQQGRSMEELRGKVLPQLQLVYTQKLPHGSDTALRSFVSLLLEQMKALYAVDPALCYDYIYGQGLGMIDETKYFSGELKEEELSVMAEVISSAASERNQPPNEKQIQKQLTKVLAPLIRRYGDDVRMLDDQEAGKANKAKTCEILYDLYQAILRLPERESGPLLRYMFASQSPALGTNATLHTESLLRE
jgi:hypothetical protein